MTQEEIEKGKNQFPIELKFEIPRNIKVLNCATFHKEWFEIPKAKDPRTRMIPYQEEAISMIKYFATNQVEYKKAFPHRIMRHQFQPIEAKIVFEI